MLKKKNKLILAILIGVLIIIIGLFVYVIKAGKIAPLAAGEVATLALSPTSGTKTIGTNFDVQILLNTQTRLTYGTDVVLNYNPLDLEVQDADAVTTGVQIRGNTPTVYSSVAANSVNTTTGKIYYSATITIGGAGYSSGTSNVVLATVTFKPLRMVASTPVTFDFTLGSTTDSNVMAAPTPAEILLSVANANFNLVPQTVSTTVNLTLQGRTNYTTSGTILTVYNTGTTTKVFEKTDVTTSSTGTGTLTITGVPAGNYDFKIKVGMYLISALTNKAITYPLTLNFGELRAGELSGDNIINTADYQILLANWFTSNAAADINKDTVVNTADFAWMSLNWLQQDQ